MRKLFVGAALTIASMVMPGQVLAKGQVEQAEVATLSQEALSAVRKKKDGKDKQDRNDTTVIIIIIVAR